MQKNSPTKKQLNVFVAGLVLIILLFSWKILKTGNLKISALLAALSFLLIIIYLIKKDFVIQFYKIWMKCAAAIGVVITGILMIGIFYLVFAPVGILLRLLRKDVLNLNKNPNLKTYWIDKPQRKFNKEDYEKQF
ncbi:MAG: hypothetical protein PHS93_04000 [Candidatus Omnitrophica bacterium]|nr:hypothetical protein [Candidatus Omnitrophota bacterium]MDD5352315.1 hypothetical protein [Candidatus Omnitrophota bacterium]MDD5549913.1 hypothetical protein [Candidatus Omnitrophota bacterium]